MPKPHAEIFWSYIIDGIEDPNITNEQFSEHLLSFLQELSAEEQFELLIDNLKKHYQDTIGQLTRAEFVAYLKDKREPYGIFKAEFIDDLLKLIATLPDDHENTTGIDGFLTIFINRLILQYQTKVGQSISEILRAYLDKISDLTITADAPKDMLLFFLHALWDDNEVIGVDDANTLLVDKLKAQYRTRVGDVTAEKLEEYLKRLTGLTPPSDNINEESNKVFIVVFTVTQFLKELSTEHEKPEVIDQGSKLGLKPKPLPEENSDKKAAIDTTMQFIQLQINRAKHTFKTSRNKLRTHIVTARIHLNECQNSLQESKNRREQSSVSINNCQQKIDDMEPSVFERIALNKQPNFLQQVVSWFLPNAFISRAIAKQEQRKSCEQDLSSLREKQKAIVIEITELQSYTQKLEDELVALNDRQVKVTAQYDSLQQLAGQLEKLLPATKLPDQKDEKAKKEKGYSFKVGSQMSFYPSVSAKPVPIPNKKPPKNGPNAPDFSRSAN